MNNLAPWGEPGSQVVGGGVSYTEFVPAEDRRARLGQGSGTDEQAGQRRGNAGEERWAGGVSGGGGGGGRVDR